MEDRLTVSKHYIRFLKEQGVYRRALSLHKRNLNGNVKNIFLTYRPATWVENASAFCVWSQTSEGDIFWWPISILWQCECVLNQYDEYNTPDGMVRLIDVYIDFFNRHIGEEITNIPKDTIGKLKNKLRIVRKKMLKMRCDEILF